MTSLTYDVVYSRLFSKIEAYDFIELKANDLSDLLCDWMHSASANPYVRRLFETFSLDDEIQELSFEMKYTLDSYSDTEFVIEILALGMVVAWLEPKINSINNISQMFGSKDEKWFSQSQHLSELRGLVNDSRKLQRRIIADRGYAWNTYLDGDNYA